MIEDEFEIYKVDSHDMSDELFNQIVQVEKESCDDAYSEEILKDIWVTSQKNDNFVCINHGKVIGYISFNPYSIRRNGSIYCINLVVSPNYRRRGIAQSLIKTACEYYLNCKYTLPISLSVDKNNLSAIMLYQKIGFSIQEPMNDIKLDDTGYIMEANLDYVYQFICKHERKEK